MAGCCLNFTSIQTAMAQNARCLLGWVVSNIMDVGRLIHDLTSEIHISCVVEVLQRHSLPASEVPLVTSALAFH